MTRLHRAETKRLAFLAAALFLVLFTGLVGKPGLPPTLKADEPAYLLMAESLVRDGDLRSEKKDYGRLLESYPYFPVENLILMSDDGWDTVYFGKPYLYSLLAAPLVGVFGANGLVAFNAILFMVLVWCGSRYLEQFNPPALALLFSVVFFFLSPTWPYVFWLQPELLNMAAVGLGFFFLFAEPGGGRFGRLRVIASAAALSFGIYNKPVLLAFAMPLLYRAFKKWGTAGSLRWIAGLAVTSLLLAGGSVLLTGHPTPYLGVARSGVKVQNPEAAQRNVDRVAATIKRSSTTQNSWSWVFRKPPTNLREIRQSLGYFFWGRHTGLLVYLPFAVISLLLFSIHRRHRPEGWLTLLAMAVIALFFICVIPLNWHGGGGFIGNRYFAMAYPAFLFLVTKIRPPWLLAPGAAWAGIFLGTIVFTPFGGAVPLPSLQAHTRSAPFQWFPYELTLRKTIPGYSVFSYSHVVLIGRKDIFMPNFRGSGVPRLQAAQDIDVTVMTDRPIQGLFFEVSTFTANNEIDLVFAGDSQQVSFFNAERAKDRKQIVELNPVDQPREHMELNELYYVYEMKVRAENGRRIFGDNMPSPVYYAGAELRFLGRRDQLSRPEHYRVEWLSTEIPENLEAGKPFRLSLAVGNRSESPFSSEDPLPVKLAFRWKAEDSATPNDWKRQIRLPAQIEPGANDVVELTIVAPKEPGSYALEFDLVREHVAWFSDVASAKLTVPIRIN